MSNPWYGGQNDAYVPGHPANYGPPGAMHQSEQPDPFNPALGAGGFPPAPVQAVGLALPQPNNVDLATQVAFWTTFAKHTFPNGQHVEGTHLELYNTWPELRPMIEQDYVNMWPLPQRVVPGPGPQPPLAVSHGQGGRDREPEPSDGSDSGNESPTRAQKPKGSIKKGAAAPKTVPPGRKKPDAPVPVPAYNTDVTLTSMDVCRRYIAYQDIADSPKKLDIANDDWAVVKASRIEEFVGRLYTALSSDPNTNVPAGIELKDQAKEHFQEQQKTYLGKVVRLMQTPQQLKASKAQCYLLVDATIQLHEVGVNKEFYESHKWYVDAGRKTDRKFHLDTTSICSARLDGIVKVISGNKLVAHDVLTGKNFTRLARDSKYYLQEKFQFLSSNKVRQEKVDEINAKEEEGEEEDNDDDPQTPVPKSGKRKGRGTKQRDLPKATREDDGSDADAPGSTDDEFATGDFQPASKRSKQ